MWPLIDQLVQQGISDFFLAPGSRSTPLAIALSRHPEIRLHRHFDERGLGFYSLGFAIGREKPAALVITSGTAVGNIMPAVMEAHHASTPLLLLTADRPPELRDASANQTTDQMKIFQNFVRWQFDLDPTMPEKAIRSKAAQAVFRATHPHPGPVHINCPFREPLYPLSEESFTKGAPIPLEAASYASISSRHLPAKGILLIGRLPQGSDIAYVLDLAKRLQWPVFADVLSSARLYNTPEQIRHFDWLFWNEPPKPDCVLHFGERLTSKRLMEWLTTAQPSSYLHVSPHSHWCDSWHLLTERIYAPVPAACASFTTMVEPEWLRSWKELDEQAIACLKEASSPLFTETSAVQFLNTLPLEEWAIFLANSMPIREGDWFLFPNPCKGFFANRGLSGIDGNIATLVGLSIGINAPVLAILGDLTTLHDLNSLSLLKSSPHPILILVSNNDGCGIFSHLAVAPDPHFETLFGFAHGLSFESAAAMFQIPYAFADGFDSLAAAMTKALSEKRSCLIEIKTSRKQNHAYHRCLKKLFSKEFAIQMQ